MTANSTLKLDHMSSSKIFQKKLAITSPTIKEVFGSGKLKNRRLKMKKNDLFGVNDIL